MSPEIDRKANRERARRAGHALRAWRRAEGGIADEADLDDLMADCLHLAAMTGRDPLAMPKRAWRNFEAEYNGEE